VPNEEGVARYSIDFVRHYDELVAAAGRALMSQFTLHWNDDARLSAGERPLPICPMTWCSSTTTTDRVSSSVLYFATVDKRDGFIEFSGSVCPYPQRSRASRSSITAMSIEPVRKEPMMARLRRRSWRVRPSAAEKHPQPAQITSLHTVSLGKSHRSTLA